ncbi:molybdopterin-dependent oxidoreductase [Veillonella sp. VA139]|uniref:molybdopterin-dependent oxidoreductase n=1 Tax=Veillonella sp. VA139 TaxID=741830 RepID=UPI000F8E5B21|nr:molybdopterin-dependent oxidoreductase [Veillonella sp. VA139]
MMKPIHTRTSVCPYDCPDACGLTLTVEGDRLQQVRGMKTHSFTRGTLCQKMQYYERTVHHSGRLTTPLRRTGPKGSGQFTPITWDEALQEIAKKFQYCIDTYGSESIMPYSYAGTMGILQKSAGDPLFAILGATRQDKGICSPAKRYGWVSLMGNTLGNRPQDIQHSDCVVLWSLNAVATDVHVLHDVTIARQRGAKLWVIDTYYTETTKLADEVIIIRPGTDGAFALGVAHVLAEEGLVNTEFIHQYVQGYEGFRDSIISQYPLSKVAQITGVPEERIIEFARAYGQAVAPFIRLGSGLSRYGNGANTVRCVVALPALVGAYLHKGGGLLSSASGSTFVGGQRVSWERFQVKETRLNPMIHLGPMLTEADNPPIKALYVYSSNPAVTSPDQMVVCKGLAREDLFTVVHERFMTDTAKYADIVLPATTSVEHNDIYNSYGHYTIGCGYQAIPPVGESRSNWNTICSIAGVMGIDNPVFAMSELEMIEDIVRHAPIATEVQDRILSGELVEMDLSDTYKLEYGTPSGKIELYNPLEREPYPVYHEAYGDTGEFFLINGADPRILDSSFCENQEDTPKMVARMHPEDANRKGVLHSEFVRLSNERGSLRIALVIDDTVPQGTIVSSGVWWQSQSHDSEHTINVLTASRPTDYGWGSTFYDVKVNVESCD